MQMLLKLRLLAVAIAVGGLMAAPAAKSVDEEPACATVCTTNESGQGLCTITADGPRTIEVSGQTVTLWDYTPECDLDGDGTIDQTLDHFEITFPANKTPYLGLTTPDTDVEAACVGNLSNKNDCSEKTIVFNRFNQANGIPVTLGAYGDWLPQSQGATVKKGNKLESCAICGIGIGAPAPEEDPRIPELLSLVTQVQIAGQICELEYDSTANNGEGAIVRADGPYCNITNGGAGFLVGTDDGTGVGFTLDGVDAGPVLTMGGAAFQNTGNGSVGNGSCAYQFVKETGRVYLVCSCGEDILFPNDPKCTDYEKSACPTGTRCQDEY